MEKEFAMKTSTKARGAGRTVRAKQLADKDELRVDFLTHFFRGLSDANISAMKRLVDAECATRPTVKKSRKLATAA